MPTNTSVLSMRRAIAVALTLFFTIASTTAALACEQCEQVEHVSVRITTMCEYDGSMVLQLQREDTNTAFPNLPSYVYKDDARVWSAQYVGLEPGETEYVLLEIDGNPTEGLTVRSFDNQGYEVHNDLSTTASRTGEPCGASVTPHKEWTDTNPDRDTGVELTYTGQSYVDPVTDRAWTILNGQTFGVGDTFYLPYGETFDVTEDDGPWVPASGLGEGLVIDAPTTLAELAVRAPITWTVTNTYVPPPPEVQLEKVWFDSADDDIPVAVFRQTGDGWGLTKAGPEGYVPPTDFVLPDGFDLTVEYGDDTYSVTEVVPAGWQPMACGAEAPMPNGLGDFPYERPVDPDDDIVSRRPLRPTQDVIRHTVCNARVPLVPDVELTKTPDVAAITYDPGDGDDETVTYTYVVTNTGETALTGLTLVDDVLGAITLPFTDLAVGATLGVEAVHIVTAADAAAEEVANTATVTGTAPDETTVDDTATARVAVDVTTNPAISLEKSALVPIDDDGEQLVVWSAADPDGTTITYEYLVTNTGDTALTGLTLVDDVLGTIDLTDTDLAVGESTTVQATHTVTAADVAAGEVDNTAVATAVAPDDTEVTASADASVLVGEVLADVLGAEDEQDTLPAAGAATMVLALAAVAGAGGGAVLLTASRRRE